MNFDFAERSVEVVVLAASLLLMLSVVLGKAFYRFGFPALLAFLALGMLAGSEGPVGIEFENYGLTFAVGSIALALILFDGGMSTPWNEVKPVLLPGISLSTVGVFVTAGATAAFAHFALGLSWKAASVLGAIISSTDAAAVFSILRSKNLTLKGTTKQLLQFEAGSNDPTAVFLTLGFLQLAQFPDASLGGFLRNFLLQFLLGILFGWLPAKAFTRLLNKIGLEYEGLYSVFSLAFALLIFSGASLGGGNGFLAVYVSGLVIGNSEIIHRRTIVRFHDGVAWIAQISLFLMLGLLSFPSRVFPMWEQGLILAIFLSFISRPICVFIATAFAKLSLRERVFSSWVGLRGAAPILLGTLPWTYGFANAESIFDLVFFVVLITVPLQGITIPWLATRLGLTDSLPMLKGKAEDVTVMPAGFSLVELEIEPDAPAVNNKLVNVGLPGGVLLTSIQRRERYVLPSGETVFEAGDKVLALARPSNFEALNSIFGAGREVVRTVRS